MSRSWSLERRSGSWNGTRSPRRYGVHTGHVPRIAAPLRLWSTRPCVGNPAEHRPGPVDEEGAGVARATDEDLVGHRVGDGPQTRRLDPLVDHGPHDERGPEDHEDVARRSIAPETIWSHSASTVPPAMWVSVPGTVPADWPMGTTSRHLRDVDPDARQVVLVPLAPRVQRSERRGHRRCRWPGPRRGRTWRRPGPASSPPASGASRDRPAHEALGVAHGDRLDSSSPSASRHGAPDVAVEQARGSGHAAPVDGRQRRHHARHAHPGHVEARCTGLATHGLRPERAPAARPGRRRARDGRARRRSRGGGRGPGRRRHRRRDDGQPFDRRGPDVDADGDRPRRLLVISNLTRLS